MNKYLLIAFLPILILSQNLQRPCATESRTAEQAREMKQLFENYSMENNTRVDDPVHILVKFHVIHASNGDGNVSDENIYEHFEWVNEAFAQHNFVFTVVSIDRTENDEWFVNWDGQEAWPAMQQLAEEPYYYLNAYSADLESMGAWGYSYLGNAYGPSAYQQSINLHYTRVAYGLDTGVHEIGHHLGLDHTFSGSCSITNDGIDDTPAMDENENNSCNENQDSCPELEGLDPVRNYMNYSSDDCRNNFTLGQDDYMGFITTNYHPGYLTHDLWYPNLSIDAISINQDSDGDGIFNPGDTARILINLESLVGITASGVTLNLFTEDERLFVIDNTVTFPDSIPPNTTTFNFLDWFEVYVDPNASLGTITCSVLITTDNQEYPYHNIVPIEIPISLNQAGFPTENFTIKSSPIISDLNSDLSSEIYFGSDNGKFYGFDQTGQLLNGYPIDADADLRSSPAVGDLDGDGQNEIVFGSNDGKLFILNSDGSQNLIYPASGSINGSPALYDLDNNGDLEIIFTTDYNSSGKVYAINYNGENLDGFPVDISEKMLVGAAVADLENDGIADIVVCTWGENIYSLNQDGNIKTGFPFISGKRFNAPPTLADITLDGNLEIIAGNDDGILHILNFSGSELYNFDTGDDIRGGISVADLDDDGSKEILFSGYDDLVHVWNPISGQELEGWPVDLGANSLTEPLVVDLDNNGDLEVVAANKNGVLFVFNHDSSPFGSFPISLGGAVESTPVISDLDRDGDFEIAIGTTMGLKVIDVKTEKGEQPSWKLFRGNMGRSGTLGISMLAINDSEKLAPSQFNVSANYPNPFNPSTSIDIIIIDENNLNVSIYDVSGRLINTLKNTSVLPGSYKIRWMGNDLKGRSMPTGIYFLQVHSGKNINSQKVLLIK